MTCKTTRFESPNTSIFLTLRSLAAFNPRIRASYSAMLFVVSNSNLYEKVKTSFAGEVKNIPVVTPYFDEDPSKNIFHR